MRNKIDEMGFNDVHLKNVLSYFDSLDDERERQMVGYAVLRKYTSNREEIIDALLNDIDYLEILQIEDELGIGDEYM
jgi:hypothetical protein